MWFVPIISLVIAGAVLFTVFMRKHNKNYGSEFEEYVRTETEANASKSRQIDDSAYFVPDIDALPVCQDDGGEAADPCVKRQRDVLKRAAQKMIRFDAPLTNTELKLKYGAVNLEFISLYEENFFTYIYAVNDWAESLIKAGREAEAEAVLRHGVQSGSETSKTFMMLADIYFKNDKREDMLELYSTVSEKRMPAQEKVWRYVNDYYVKMNL